MAVKRESVTQPSKPASGGNGDMPRATGFVKSPARGGSHNGSGHHKQLNIRSR